MAAGDCDLLLEDGTSLLLEDGTSVLLENCTPTDVGICDLLLEDGTSILLEDGSGALILESCLTTSPSPQGGFVISLPRRRRPIDVRIPLFEDEEEDEAIALALLQALRGVRRLDG